MRPPSWMVQVAPFKGEVTPDGRHVRMYFRVRYWHPYVWWLLLRRLERLGVTPIYRAALAEPDHDVEPGEELRSEDGIEP
jgi:hypothetical protein